MQTNVIQHIRQLDVSPESWNRLLQKAETNTVFQSYEWLDSWWRVFGGEHRLLIVTAYDEGELVGLAPLMVSTTDHGERQLRFIGDNRADYLDFIVDRDCPGVAQALLEHIFALSPHWDRLWLKNIPARSPSNRLLKDFCQDGDFKQISSADLQCPALIIEGRQAEAQQIANKYSLRRPHNKLARLGKVGFRHVIDASELQRMLEVFFEQHIRRWEGTDSPSLFHDPRNRQFFRLLSQALLPKGWLLFSVVEFNDAPVAFHFGFDYNQSVIWYKPSFDPGHQQYSPGLVLLKGLIDYSVSNNRREFDFTIGDEPFKERYANATRYNAEMNVYRHASQYYMHSVVRNTRRMVKQAIRG